MALKSALGALAGALVLAACAQTRPEFPTHPSVGTLYHSLQRPDGDSRVPAVILLHTCAGLRPHILEWASRLTERGYAAVVVDSFTPRGVRGVCGTWGVSVGQVADDAFRALDHLQKRSDVDAGRVGVIGFSYGAMAALRVASARYHRRARGFGAVVGVYPVCVNPRPDWSGRRTSG